MSGKANPSATEMRLENYLKNERFAFQQNFSKRRLRRISKGGARTNSWRVSGLELPSKKCELECCKPKQLLNHFLYNTPGPQLVILDGRGRIHEKGLHQNLLKMKWHSNTVFRFVSGRNTVEGLLISLLLKANEQGSEEKAVGLGAKPRER